MKHGNWQIEMCSIVFSTELLKSKYFHRVCYLMNLITVSKYNIKDNVLQLNKIRKSAMQRYEFYGVIYYIKGKTQVTIDT